jgi:thiol-disulfide isomerase/thioredoxin
MVKCMHKVKFAPVVGTLVSLLIGSVTAASAAPSFNQAVADYNAGKYSQALGEFKQFVAAYPTNAQSHYYMALCYQSMGKRIEAKQEFMLTSQYGDASLKGYADKALAFLGTASSGGVQSVRSIGAASTTSASAAGKTQAAAAPAVDPGGPADSPCGQILEFYTDWCGYCKKFLPSWEAAQSHFRSVRFQRYNAEDPGSKALVKQYDVKGYPTLVFLDRSGNVLKNMGGAPGTTEEFYQVIRSPQ